MNISMFTSWQVRCGIANYSSSLVDALLQLDDTHVDIVPFDRQAHPRSDFQRWGRLMNAGDVAHIQHEYAFFGYLLPWKNHFHTFTSQIKKPLVITRHVTFDGPLLAQGSGLRHWLWKAKWSLYNARLNPYATYLNKGIFDTAQQVIVLSGRLKDHLLARGIREDKVHIVPPGVPAVQPALRDDTLRKAWGWLDKRIVCQFGFVAPAKGHPVALEALAQLPEDYVYLIAGGPRIQAHQTYANDIFRRAESLGLSHRIRMIGFMDEMDIARTIASSDLLVFPNTHADFSYSLITAIAYSSAPIIASNLYSHREVAEDCSGIALFNTGNANQLAQEIIRLCKDAATREYMLAGLRDYAQRHTWARVAEQTRAIYQLAMCP